MKRLRTVASIRDDLQDRIHYAKAGVQMPDPDAQHVVPVDVKTLQDMLSDIRDYTEMRVALDELRTAQLRVERLMEAQP